MYLCCCVARSVRSWSEQGCEDHRGEGGMGPLGAVSKYSSVRRGGIREDVTRRVGWAQTLLGPRPVSTYLQSVQLAV